MIAAVALLTLGMVSCDKDDNNTSQIPTTTGNPSNPTNPTNPTTGMWVDLGLPSGLLWARCNVGATTPEEYGNYYAWGEIRTKSEYSWETYAYGDYDSESGNYTYTMYKYNTEEDYGSVDNKTTLEADDDAASVVLGGGARIPTADEWQELLDNTTAEWTTVNNVSGIKLTSKTNGNRLFLPAAGQRYDSELDDLGEIGGYQSASLYTYSPRCAWDMCFSSSDFSSLDFLDVDFGYRSDGHSVRAVRSASMD